MIGIRYRGNYYGVRWMPVRAHISLGLSAHIGGRFSHLSIHLPFGVLVVGMVGS